MLTNNYSVKNRNKSPNNRNNNFNDEISSSQNKLDRSARLEKGTQDRSYHQIDDNMSDSGITEASFDLFAVQTGMLDHSVYMEEDSKGKAKFGIQG